MRRRDFLGVSAGLAATAATGEAFVGSQRAGQASTDSPRRLLFKAQRPSEARGAWTPGYACRYRANESEH